MLNRLIIDPRVRAKRSDLVDTPVVIRLNKTFSEDMGEKFFLEMNKAHDTGQTIIPVIVDSYGGMVDNLIDMITQIQNAKLPVATIVMGKAMSAAAMLFGFGTLGHRYIAENARIMIHDVSSEHGGKVEEIKADAKEVDRLNNLLFTMLARHLGKKDNYFLDILHERGHAEWYLTAKEVKKHGLADHIGVPQLITEVSVNYKFGI